MCLAGASFGPGSDRAVLLSRGAFRPITNDLTDHSSSFAVGGWPHPGNRADGDFYTDRSHAAQRGRALYARARRRHPRSPAELLLDRGWAIADLSRRSPDPAAYRWHPRSDHSQRSGSLDQRSGSCDNDRWIALNWMVHDRGSANGLWRANPDGSGAVPLTSKQFGSLWGCSPDGKWLYYTEQITNGVSRIAAGGGKPELVPGANPPNSLTVQATLSPDGKTLAIFTEVLNPESKTYSNRIVLDSLDSGVRNLDLDPTLKAVFRSQGPPDSAGFHFSRTENPLTSSLRSGGGTTFGCSRWTAQKGES